MDIRQESPFDHAAIHHIHQEAFAREAEALLVDALRKNGSVFIPGLSLVTTDDDDIIAHVLFMAPLYIL